MIKQGTLVRFFKLNAHDRHYGPPVEADDRDAELDLSENLKLLVIIKCKI